MRLIFQLVFSIYQNTKEVDFNTREGVALPERIKANRQRCKIIRLRIQKRSKLQLFNYYFIFMCLAFMYVCASHMWLVLAEVRQFLGAGWSFDHHVGTGKQTKVLCKNDKCSSSPYFSWRASTSLGVDQNQHKFRVSIQEIPEILTVFFPPM